MIWQDWAILIAQLVCLVSLWPTLRDRRRWPPVSTVLPTGLALALMATALLTLSLYLSATLVYGLAGAWLSMLRRRGVTDDLVIWEPDADAESVELKPINQRDSGKIRGIRAPYDVSH